ncbi:hypothetical protein MKW92_000354 [Papaver armeniacum]|nr:hypothetical protein MKW92_000354 [Papaver armeniacum]
MRNAIADELKTSKGSISATQDNIKSFRSLDEGKLSIITVRVTRKWEELDFMSTNQHELHAIIPENLIWKFDKQIQEGGLYSIYKLHLTAAKPKLWPANSGGLLSMEHLPHRLGCLFCVDYSPQFCFAEFESLESNLQNIHLTGNFYYLHVVPSVINILGPKNNKTRLIAFVQMLLTIDIY